MPALDVTGPPKNGTAALGSSRGGSDARAVYGDAEHYQSTDSFATFGARAELAARLEFYRRAGLECVSEGLAYARANGVGFTPAFGLLSGAAVLPIVEESGRRFELGQDNCRLAFVVEAYGAFEGEFRDFVAWPLDDPSRVLSMFGRVGLLGLWNAYNPATYWNGGNLEVFRTGLAWLQARCRGAVIIDRRIAARELFDCQGPICGQDAAHARELLELADGILDRRKFLAPLRRVAA